MAAVVLGMMEFRKYMKSINILSYLRRIGRPFGPLSSRNLPKDFNPDTYLLLNPDVASAGTDAVIHYLTCGKAEGRIYKLPSASERINYSSDTGEQKHFLPEDFNPEDYLLFNPDVAASGAPAVQHYIDYGRHEGRIYRTPSEMDVSRFDMNKPTCIIVSHEASLTGAPVLSLNLAKTLASTYNIVTILLGDGELEKAFQSVSSWCICEGKLRLNYDVIDVFIKKLKNNGINIDFSIVNSIESRYCIEHISKFDIPVISLVHEFAAYTRPIDAFYIAFLWSHKVVFSTALTYNNAIEQHPDLQDTAVKILPQGRCAVPQIEPSNSPDKKDVGKLAHFIKTNIKPSGDEVLILGAGTIQYRKGVDLFLQVASIFAKQGLDNCRFVWIGKGYTPEKDMIYSAYLRDQINRSGLKGKVTLLPESAEIEALYDRADICFLSSRLDPLPNIAIDALVRGIPLVCFDGASGISEILQRYGLGAESVAEYLSVEDAADKVKRLAESSTLRKEIGEKGREIAENAFDWNNYTNELLALVDEGKAQVAREKRDIEVLLNSNTFDYSYHAGESVSALEAEETLRRYVRSWATRVSPRKPRPGFHPGVYSEINELGHEGGDAFANYIAAGMPTGPWDNVVINLQSDFGVLPTDLPSTALHIHAYYPDILDEIVERVCRNTIRPDLFVSVPSEQAKCDANKSLSSYVGGNVDIRITPNLGRDIGPMITEFGRELAGHYDIVGHVHSKKSDNFDSDELGKTWRNFLFENLLGGERAGGSIDKILQAMDRNPKISMVFPDDPYEVGWQSNLEIAASLAPDFGIEAQVLPKHFLFPVGTMFWSRSAHIEPLLKSGLDWDDYPTEPLPYDGTKLHAIERIIGLLGYQIPGFAPATLHTPGVYR